MPRPALFLYGALLFPAVLAAAPAVTLIEQPDRLRVEIDGELFTEYLHPADRYFPAFYPILGPGEVPMTRRYPFETVEGEDTDHPHHQSLWFAHSEVNGHSFWAVQPHGGREPGRTVHRGFTDIESGEGEGRFVAKNDYVASDGTVIMSDVRTVRLLAPAEKNGPRQIDITIAFTATNGDVTFGDQKDAGMAIRVASELQVEKRTGDKKATMVEARGKLLNSEGVEGKETWGKRARWVDAYGEVGGKPVGIAIFDHPSNPRHPTHWHSRTYGLVTANAFGKRHFENLDDPTAGQLVLPKGETITFRWRFVFHQGDPKQADVEGLYQKFAGE